MATRGQSSPAPPPHSGGSLCEPVVLSPATASHWAPAWHMTSRAWTPCFLPAPRNRLPRKELSSVPSREAPGALQSPLLAFCLSFGPRLPVPLPATHTLETVGFPCRVPSLASRSLHCCRTGVSRGQPTEDTLAFHTRVTFGQHSAPAHCVSEASVFIASF